VLKASITREDTVPVLPIRFPNCILPISKSPQSLIVRANADLVVSDGQRVRAGISGPVLAFGRHN
jgi:hypothetical protein